VAYRETITKRIKCNYKHVKQTGGHGQYAHVIFEMFPVEAGTGFSFESKISGGSIPKEYFKAIEQGFKQASETGHLAGFPMTDVGFVLLDGNHHDVDSSEMAFRTAAMQGVKENLGKAGPQLQEPLMSLEVVVPDEYLGDVMGDLNSRRGNVSGLDMRGKVHVVSAEVPLKEMFGYATELRSRSQGRATYTMQFSHFKAVPTAVAEEIVTKAQGG
jgi:elongation factor G